MRFLVTRFLATGIALVPALLSAQQSPPLFFAGTAGDKLSLFSDRLGDADMYGFGVESNALFYRANGAHRWYSQTTANGGTGALMTLSANGHLGIGTPNPEHELVVQGDNPALQIRDDLYDNSENAARLELLERAGGSFSGGAFMYWNGVTNRLHIGTKLNTVNSSVLVIDRANLNVGIGTSVPNSQYRLSVNGKVRAKEIVVETGWSDFVFAPGCRLRPLTEVSAFIATNGHLPDVPSASEVATHGVSVGEVEAKLLQKVEELTLYLIETHERLNALERENARLRGDGTGERP